MAMSVLDVSPNGSAPRCEHVDSVGPAIPSSSGCRECQALGAHWRRLLVCLTCGWVACSDDSTYRHALAHYEETDHPLAADLTPGSGHRWCYVHQRGV
jgi:uncharacterized UBP type Zn finger protein